MRIKGYQERSLVGNALDPQVVAASFAWALDEALADARERGEMDYNSTHHWPGTYYVERAFVAPFPITLAHAIEIAPLLHRSAAWKIPDLRPSVPPRPRPRAAARTYRAR